MFRTLLIQCVLAWLSVSVLFCVQAYAVAITPPWNPDSSTAALFHFDDPFDDSDAAGRGAIYTGGSNADWSANGKFSAGRVFVTRQRTSDPKTNITLPYGLITSSGFTIDLWARFNRIVPTGLGYEVIGKDHWVLSSSSLYIRYNIQASQIEFGIYTAQGWKQVGSGKALEIRPDKWYYICCVYDGSQIKLFINGIACSTISTGIYYPVTSYTLGGCGWADDLISEFNGCLDEVRFSSTVRFGSYQDVTTNIYKYPVKQSASAVLVTTRGPEAPPSSVTLKLFNNANQLINQFADNYSGQWPSTKIFSLGILQNQTTYRSETWFKWPDNNQQLISSQTFTIPARPIWSDCNTALLNGVVPKPWVPTEVNGTNLSCWGRTYSINNSFMPTSIISSGQNILSNMLSFTATDNMGQSAILNSSSSFSGFVRSSTGDKVDYNTITTSSLCDLKVSARLEFDGFMSFDVNVIPKTSLKKFVLEIPLTNEIAKYIEPLSAVEYSAGAIPSGGVQLDFGNSVWLCNEKAGIFVLFDSKQNWLFPAGQAIEVIRRGSDTLLRINFYNSTQLFSTSRSYRFHLQATPIRPFNPDWFAKGNRVISGVNLGYNTIAVENDVVQSLALDQAALSPKGAFEIILQNYNYLNEMLQMPYYHPGVSEHILKIVSGSNTLELLFDKYSGNGMKLVTPWGISATLNNCNWQPNETHKLAFTWGDKIRFYVDGVLQQGIINTVGFQMPNARIDLGSVTARYLMKGLRVSSKIDLASLSSIAPMIADENTICIYSSPLDLRSSARTGLNVYKQSGAKTMIMFENWQNHQNGGTSIYEPMMRNLVEDCHRAGLKFCLYWGFQIADVAENQDIMDECKSLNDQLYLFDPVRGEHTYFISYGSPYQEYIIYHMKRLKDKLGIDGVYLDGSFEISKAAANNPGFACGYIDDNDTLQPEVPVDRVRQFAKRVNNLFGQDDGVIWAHLGIQVPTMGFASNYFYGEQLVGAFNNPALNILQIIPQDMAKCLWNGRVTGVPSTLVTLQNGRITAGPYADLNSFGQLITTTEDLTGTLSECDSLIIAKAKKLARFAADSAQWYPYWETESLIPSSPSGAFKTSLYKRIDGSMVLAIMNVTAAAANGWIDLSAADFKPTNGFNATDIATGNSVTLASNKLYLNLSSFGGKTVLIGNNFMPGDFNHDDKIDFNDINFLSEYWLNTNCSPFDCQDQDINADLTINFKDLGILSLYWLFESN